MNRTKTICICVILCVLVIVSVIGCAQLSPDSDVATEGSTVSPDTVSPDTVTDTVASADTVTDTVSTDEVSAVDTQTDVIVSTTTDTVTDVTPSTDAITDVVTSGDEVTSAAPPVEKPVEEGINPEYRIEGLPEFVNTTAEFTDAKKYYVLPDGYLYAHTFLGWIRTVRYVPSDWHGEIAATVNTIKGLDLPDDSQVTKFMLSSDIHYTIGFSKCSTDSIGKVSAEVMRACDIPFFVDAGDTSTQSAEYMPDYFKDNIAHVLEQFSPIPRKNLLFGVGNHDGATGMKLYKGEMVYYRHQLNNEQRSEVFFGWQRESNTNKVFNSDGTYYYLDDPYTKTRYIVLNSYWSKWEGDADGFVRDLSYSFFHAPMFGSEQLNWFANEALDMPEGYGAIIVAHQASNARDFYLFQGIVDAYSSKGVYEGYYRGSEDWQSIDISVKYRKAKGEIIAMFQGHIHQDVLHDYFVSVPCINITTTGASWDVRDENAVTRVKGTATEFAVDTVVIDRVNRIIYLVRLGAGEDRVIHY